MASWAQLNGEIGRRLIEVRSPLHEYRDDPGGIACDDLFGELENPYHVGGEVGLTQTAGWLDAWTSQPNVFAVAAETTEDVVAAVSFSRLQAAAA